MSIDLPSAVLAIGSLGTASFALVDATKAFGGGISNRGFGYIAGLLQTLSSKSSDKSGDNAAPGFEPVRRVLRANWLNGATSLGDQKAIAKTLIKLQLDASTAEGFAQHTGVDANVLLRVAGKYSRGEALNPVEQNVAGRFDLGLSTMLDEAYQRADQSYRNSAKVLAVMIAILLAIAGNLALGEEKIGWGVAFLAGLLAAPLAPVSKDLASALQASTKALQILRK